MDIIQNLMDEHANAPIRLLERLIHEELCVPTLRSELEKRGCPTKGLLKADLSETLRSSIENNEAAGRPGDLARLREQEMRYVGDYKKKPLVAKLTFRGLSKSGSKPKLAQRLLEALEKERRAFIDRRTEIELAKQGPRALETWKKGFSSFAQEDRAMEKHAVTQQQQQVSSAPAATAKAPGVVDVGNMSSVVKKHTLTEEQRRRMEENRLRALEIKEKRVITEEQRKRMEENRKRALEIKKNRALKDSQDAARKKVRSPAPASPKKNPYKTPPNPYKNVSLTSTERKKSYAPEEEISEVPPSSQVVTPASAAKAESFAPCARCGLPNDQDTLCIVWAHRGDVERERNPMGGQDQFRYECCGQLNPNPCFVGRHTCDPRYDSPPWSSRWGRSLVVQCHCGKPAHLCRTKKDGRNKGRLFFNCNTARKDVGCDFFQWTNEAFDLPPQRVKPAFDRVVECAYPHANPFGERLGPGVPEETMAPERRRRRLIAALLVHVMCSLTSGEKGFTTAMIRPEQLIEEVTSAWSKGEVRENLYPLNEVQIKSRFGPIEGLSSPREEECMSVLTELLKDGSPIIRSTISLEHIKGMTAMPDATLVNMSGLEAYLSI